MTESKATRKESQHYRHACEGAGVCLDIGVLTMMESTQPPYEQTSDQPLGSQEPSLTLPQQIVESKSETEDQQAQLNQQKEALKKNINQA